MMKWNPSLLLYLLLHGICTLSMAADHEGIVNPFPSLTLSEVYTGDIREVRENLPDSIKSDPDRLKTIRDRTETMRLLARERHIDLYVTWLNIRA